MDLFGNGLPDLLEMNGTVRYWRNLGGGRFDLPRPMRDAPGRSRAGRRRRAIDRCRMATAAPICLSRHDAMSGYFPLQFRRQWDRRSFQRYRQAPSFNLEDPEVKLVDLDGDGVTDAIRSGSSPGMLLQRPERGLEQHALGRAPGARESFPTSISPTRASNGPT